jgi:hypothetical protein
MVFNRLKIRRNARWLLRPYDFGESLFLRKLVLGIPAPASGKNVTRPLNAFGAPDVPHDYAQDRLCCTRLIPGKGYQTALSP